MTQDPVDAVWQYAREHPDLPIEAWIELHIGGLGDAIRSNDTAAGVGLAVFSAVAAEALGRVRESLAYLDHALELFETDPIHAARLLSLRGLIQAVSSDPRGWGTTKKALHLPVTDPVSTAEVHANAAITAAALLRPDAVERAVALQRDADNDATRRHAFGALPWTVPAMHAYGLADQAAAVQASLHAYAEVADSPHRRAYVTAFSIADGVRRGGLAPVAADTIEDAPRNRIARWHLFSVRLYRALLTGDRASCYGALDELRAMGVTMNPSWLEAVPYFEAAAHAALDDVVEVTLPAPPPATTLVILPGALAGLWAASQVGRQDQAVAWYRWAKELPSHLVTSMTWPTAITRLVALLEARLGLTRQAAQRMEQAAHWGESHGYPIERASAQVQWAQLVSIDPAISVSEERWRAMRGRGRATLVEHGVAPATFELHMTRAMSLGRVSTFAPKLTSREVEILRLLAAGVSPTEIAAQLSISLRTVHTHTAHAYGKLDAHNRIEAIARARQHGIIQ